jgi:biotin transport system substrate-specific component
VAEGSLGLPFFSGGTGGIAHLFGPTGGYLVGCVAAAFVAGLIVERGRARHPVALLLTLIAADLVVFVFGVAWLSVFTGPGKALALGFAPFVIGDALKIAVAWSVLTAAAMVTSRLRQRTEKD